MDQSIYLRWEKRTDDVERYYIVHVHRDLLGDLVFLRAWGGIGQATGQIKSRPVESNDDALVLVDKTIKKRTRRGYQLVSGFADILGFETSDRVN